MFRLVQSTTLPILTRTARSITYSRQYFEDLNIDREAI